MVASRKPLVLQKGKRNHKIIKEDVEGIVEIINYFCLIFSRPINRYPGYNYNWEKTITLTPIHSHCLIICGAPLLILFPLTEMPSLFLLPRKLLISWRVRSLSHCRVLPASPRQFCHSLNCILHSFLLEWYCILLDYDP